MAGDKILVFGGTGPAGICLLRELIHRNHDVVVYARNPSKIPADLASNPKLEVFHLNQFCFA
jgi:putative NADH-flavin reductase